MSNIAIPKGSQNKAALKNPDGGPVFCKNWIDELDKSFGEKISNFLIPGDSEISSLRHVIRTKIRTTERRIVFFNRQEKLQDYILVYMNRLSDLFFTLARADLYNSDT